MPYFEIYLVPGIRLLLHETYLTLLGLQSRFGGKPSKSSSLSSKRDCSLKRVEYEIALLFRTECPQKRFLLVLQGVQLVSRARPRTA